jgi:hypothetical protein
MDKEKISYEKFEKIITDFVHNNNVSRRALDKLYAKIVDSSYRRTRTWSNDEIQRLEVIKFLLKDYVKKRRKLHNKVGRFLFIGNTITIYYEIT